MRNFQKGSSANMLEAFQKKLDSLLEVEVESSTDIFSTVTVNDPLPDDYYVELSNALDEYFEFSNTYTAWNIQVEEDGIHILIVNLDATTDEYIIEYDEDIEYDIDADNWAGDHINIAMEEPGYDMEKLKAFAIREARRRFPAVEIPEKG